MTERTDKKIALSIVASMYKSSPYLREFCARSTAAAEKITPDFEIVLVNDGSPDDSLEVAIELHRADPRIVVVDLSRNFGHHKAMMTGLMHASGERGFLIDCDLEEPPESLNKFWEKLDGDLNLDVVYGMQENRKGGWFERWSGRAFHHLFNMLSPIKTAGSELTTRLMTSRYVTALIAHQDKEIFMAGLWASTGFKQVGIPVEKAYRMSSSYTLHKKISLAVNAITNFSNVPLYLIFILGVFLSCCAFLLVIFYFFQWYFSTKPGVDGFTSIIISIWLVGGVILMAIGLIGIYLGKIFSEVKPWPFVIIRRIYR